MNFKLDENLSPVLGALFAAAGHQGHSVLEQSLGGEVDQRVIDVCQIEQRALVTLDLDFAQIHHYPPSRYFGIIVLRLANQGQSAVERAVGTILKLLADQELLIGRLWIVEEGRIRIHE